MARAVDPDEMVTVYRPHKAGLPNLRQYFSELGRRLDFARELSDTNMRAQNTNTALGQLWLVLNPLLLSAVYYLLFVVITGGRGVDFPQMTGGLFLFFLVSGAMQACCTSVTSAGSLILNMNFPKQLLIISQVYLALRRFAPTMGVYAVIHLVWRKPITWELLWVPYVILLATLISIGLGSFLAVWQVYFRDTAQFIPYFVRIWMYISPVLYSVDRFHASGLGHVLGHWANINPIFALMAVWGGAIHGDQVKMFHVIVATAWAVALCVGGVLHFISREREFAVRL